VMQKSVLASSKAIRMCASIDFIWHPAILAIGRRRGLSANKRRYPAF
jgi:hypothetical protein